MTTAEDEDGEFIFVKLRPKSFTKYIKCRKDIERPGWFKCSNRLLEDDDLSKFSAAEVCAWVYIMSLSSLQQRASVRINLLKSDALKRKFSREDLFSAIDKLKAKKILKSHATRALRPRNVDVTQRGGERIGKERNKAEERVNSETAIPPAAFSATPLLGKFETVEEFFCAIPALTMAAWAHQCAKYGGLPFVRTAALNALAYHGTVSGSDSWEISTWISKINAAIEHAKGKAPAPLEFHSPEPRPRAAPTEIEIEPLTQEEVLNSAANAEKFGLKLAGAEIGKQLTGSAS